MRRLAAIVVMLVGLVSLYRFCVVPWQANIVSKSLEVATQHALEGDPSASAFLRDDRTILMATAWRMRAPHDVALNMSLASALVMAGRRDEALRVYEDAFRYDRRPEMYFNRAAIRLGLGDAPGAIEDYVLAVRFNPTLIRRIQTDSVRSRVRQELRLIRPGGR